MLDYYAELELDSEWSMEELQSGLVKTQKKWLNRTNSSDLEKRTIAEKKLQVIEEAKATLLNEETRIAYDESLLLNEAPSNEVEPSIQEVDIQAWVKKINEFIRNEQFALAISQGKQWVELTPHDPTAWRFFAFSHEAFGNTEQAIEYYLYSLELDPEGYEVYADLGLIYVQLNDYQNAERYFKQSHQLEPDYKVALNGLRYVNQQFGNHDVALQYMERLAEIDPSQENNENLAEAYYLKAISIMPSNESNTYFFFEDEKIREYIALTEKAQSLHPTEEYATQLKKAEKALQKSFDWTKITLLTIPLFMMDSNRFLAIILLGVILYFSIRPRWITDRRNTVGIDMKFDRIANIYTKTIGAFILKIVSRIVGIVGISIDQYRYK